MPNIVLHTADIAGPHPVGTPQTIRVGLAQPPQIVAQASIVVQYLPEGQPALTIHTQTYTPPANAWATTTVLVTFTPAVAGEYLLAVDFAGLHAEDNFTVVDIPDPTVIMQGVDETGELPGPWLLGDLVPVPALITDDYQPIEPYAVTWSIARLGNLRTNPPAVEAWGVVDAHLCDPDLLTRPSETLATVELLRTVEGGATPGWYRVEMTYQRMADPYGAVVSDTADVYFGEPIVPPTPPDDLDTWCVVEIGPMSNLGAITAPGWARSWAAREYWDACLPDPLVDPDAGTIDGLVYAQELESLILEPTLRSLRWPNVTADDVELLEGVQPRTCEVGGRGKHVWFHDAANPHVTIAGAHLGENPAVWCSFARFPKGTTPDVDGRWRLYLGDDALCGLILEWSTTRHPRLYVREQVGDDFLEREISVFELEQGDESDRYQAAVELQWRIYIRGSVLQIHTNITSRAWIIHQVNGWPWQIAPARWRFETFSGPCAFKAIRPDFDWAGEMVTRWIDTEEAVDLSGEAEMRFLPGTLDIFGGGQTFSTTLEWLGSDEAQLRHRFRLEIMNSAGADGLTTRTPYLQRVEFLKRPTIAPRTDDWTELSPWVRSIRISDAYELAARQATVTLLPRKRVGEDATLYDRTGGLQGLYSARVSIGVRNDDGTATLHRLITGVLDLRDAQSNLAVDELSLTIHDRWYQLQHHTCTSAPSVVDRPVDEALTLWANWAGIDQVEVSGDLGDTSSADNPRAGYAQARWYPETGSSLAEAFTRLCERAGVYAYFDGEGVLQLRKWGDLRTVNQLYSTETGTPRARALRTCTLQTDLSQAITAVRVVGVTDSRARRPIVYELADPLALLGGQETSMPAHQRQIIRDAQLSSEADVIRACSAAYDRRVTGVPPLRLTAPLALWDRWPGDVISVEDYKLDNAVRDGRLITYSLDWSRQGMTVTVLLELKAR
jgi:hypothetical protein